MFEFQAAKIQPRQISVEINQEPQLVTPKLEQNTIFCVPEPVPSTSKCSLLSHYSPTLKLLLEK